MYRIDTVTDLSAAYELYHEALIPLGVYPFGDLQPSLSLMPVSLKTVEGWFAGEDRVTLGAYDGQRLVGLASGVIAAGRGSGFLSYLFIRREYRRAGLATRLCDALEARLLSAMGVTKLEAVFHNPVHLPWYIPNTKGDYHPCLPGVDMASGLYLFLKNRGWRDYARQNAYYRRMSDYEDSPKMASRREKLLAEGIELTLYDADRHYGLPELFDNINNPGWKAQVLSHIDRPIVVAVDHNARDAVGRALVVSYTGPLSVDRMGPDSPGRGNFCGIGTRTDYRGRGIGKQVFCAMCRAHRDAGADFMSLYTGFENPARNIYEAAGFKVVRSFADMRKE